MYCSSDEYYYYIFSLFIKSLNSNEDREQIFNLYSPKIRDENLRLIMSKFVVNNMRNFAIGVVEFMDILTKFKNYKYRDDVRDLVSYIFKRTVDPVQRDTIIRIVGNMPPKSLNTNVITNNIIERECPHCSKKVKSDASTTYVICGYSETGLDWQGCARDWCFRCGKKLCKSWYVNELFVSNNRYHDERCCRQYAEKNGLDPETFCCCSKIYVNHRV